MKNNKIIKIISNYILPMWFNLNYDVLYFDSIRGTKKDKEIASKSFQLRKAIYVDEKAWETTKSTLEVDSSDEYARGVVLVDKKTKSAIGTVRIIFKTAENNLPVEVHMDSAIENGIAEISRLSIAKNERSQKVFNLHSSSLFLYCCALIIGMRSNLDGVIFYSERKLVTSLKKLGFKVTKIGDKKITHCGIDRFIYFINKEGVENIYKKPELDNLIKLLDKRLEKQI